MQRATMPVLTDLMFRHFQGPEVALRVEEMREAEVALMIEAGSEEAVDAATSALEAAIVRGGANRTAMRQSYMLVWVAAFVGFAAWLGALAVSYLLFDGVDFQFAAVAMVPGLGLGAVLAMWAYPSLEIARGGETRLWRLGKVVYTLALGLVGTAIGKAIFG
jgi:hypothetical protein